MNVYWVTDFLGYPDVVQEEERKCAFLRFLKYALNENPGVIALVVSIAGVNHFDALETLCGIRSSLNNRRKTVRRSDCVDFDLDRFKTIMQERKISQREMAAALGCSPGIISNMFYQNGRRKSKKFVAKVEKVLELPQGSLIVKGE